MSASDDAKLAQSISNRIKPMLAGHGPGVQGAVLLELVSIWVAGHNPSSRAEIWKQWEEAIMDLVPLQEAEIFSRQPKPPGWK